MPGPEVSATGMDAFAAELRALVRAAEQRCGRKIDRASLAQSVHVSPQSLYAYLSGSRLPPAATLDALLIELGAVSAELRRLAELREQVEDSRRARAVPEVRNSLPADTAAFTGRDHELSKITAAVAAAGGVVTVGAIDGMPGVGKTALAVHAAHLLAAQFPDRQLFIDLHGYTPGQEPVRPADALAGLLTATGVDPRYLPADLEGRAAMWRDRLTGQQALLILDNAASSGQVAPLLPGTAGCLVLVTSRRHLADLPGLVTPVLADVLSPADAVDMFTRLAPRAADDRDQVAEVVSLAGYLPLAIGLLARVFARHQAWTLADLAAETRAGVLTIAAESDSVAAAFELSYRHLDPPEQRMFRLLGLHPGTVIDGYAAGALAGVTMREAAGLLDRLHQEGLLTETGYHRYGLHDLLRRYARDLGAVDDFAVGRQLSLDRLLDYYQYTAALARSWTFRLSRPGGRPAIPADLEVPGLADAQAALTWMRANRASLLACLDAVGGADQPDRVVALTAGLAPVLRRDGPWAEAAARHLAAIAAARSTDDRLGEANALWDLADTRLNTGDIMSAATLWEEALGIYRELADRLGEANCLLQLGHLPPWTGGQPEAVTTLEQALGIYRDREDRLGEAHSLLYLGRALGHRGDRLGAAGRMEQALAVYREIGDRLGEAQVLSGLGGLRQLAGDHAGAVRMLEEALTIARSLGSRIAEASMLHELAGVWYRSRDYVRAAGVLEEGLAITRDLGDRHNEANALTDLGILRRLLGEYQGADEALDEALTRYRDLGDPSGESAVLTEQGALLRISGDLTGAREHSQRALDLARSASSPRHEAGALAGLGSCAAAAGDIAQAKVLLRQAYEGFLRIGSPDADDVLAELEGLTSEAPGGQS